MFVSEKVIDALIDELDQLDDDAHEAKMEAFAAEQPVIIAYLFNEENLHLLTEDEQGFLQYLALIIWLSNERVNGTQPEVSEDQLGEAEERNYAMLDGTEGKTFRQRLDLFFEGHPQEDLLAFAEEAVLEDENEPDAIVTKEGREPIFMMLKTVVDVLTPA